MSQGDGGSIVNISTAGSWRPDANDLPHAMAKAGVRHHRISARAVVLTVPVDEPVSAPCDGLWRRIRR
jgi:hypothetical protein